MGREWDGPGVGRSLSGTVLSYRASRMKSCVVRTRRDIAPPLVSRRRRSHLRRLIAPASHLRLRSGEPGDSLPSHLSLSFVTRVSIHRPHAPPVLPSSSSATRAAALSASSGAECSAAPGAPAPPPDAPPPDAPHAPEQRSAGVSKSVPSNAAEGVARAAAIPVPLASPSKSDAPNRDDAPPPKSEDVEENADAEETETDSDDGIPYPLANRERRESPPDGVVGGAARTEPSKSAPRGASS